VIADGDKWDAFGSGTNEMEESVGVVNGGCVDER